MLRQARIDYHDNIIPRQKAKIWSSSQRIEKLGAAIRWRDLVKSGKLKVDPNRQIKLDVADFEDKRV